ncbi:hypothetical protein L218DRAFT_992782 [Marasmius fiardii PR-910]|nr:hypothetical protein L218DRAFT_992782 [Marasmius fiardii PR-910]
MIKLSGDEEQLLGPVGSSAESSEPSASSSASIPVDPPPSFSIYSADFFTNNSGNVVSHDPHLNTDGEALYRFLLSQSTTRPSLLLHCKASHQETRYRTVTSRRSDGHSHQRTESYTETVVDFDFLIDLSNVLLPLDGPGEEPTHWSCSDTEPAYRGRMYREIEDSPSSVTPDSLSASASGSDSPGKRQSMRAENKLFEKWRKFGEDHGLPPWLCRDSASSVAIADANLDQLQMSKALRSSKTVRQWADEYCASPKYLKEFTYHKVIYGWNKIYILHRVNQIITTATGPFYRGDVQVEFQYRNYKIHIRPDNYLSRILSNVWFKIILWILLIYPFIWLFQRFATTGGGRWEVCGGAYPITRYVPFESVVPPPPSGKEQEQPPDYDESMAGGSSSSFGMNDETRYTADGRRFIRQGVSEKQWLSEWEMAIHRAVRTGHQSTIPLAGVQSTGPRHL